MSEDSHRYSYGYLACWMDRIHALPTADCPNIHHRYLPDRLVGTWHTDRHVGVLCGRFPSSHYQLLPMYRESKDIHLPFIIKAADYAAAFSLYTPSLLEPGWCMVRGKRRRSKPHRKQSRNCRFAPIAQ